MRDVTAPAHPFSSAFIPNQHQDHRKQREKLFNIVFFAMMKRFLRSAIVATSLFTSPSKAFQKSQQQLASSTSSSTLIMSHPSPELTVYGIRKCTP
jgi:hypothetical protein